MKEEKKKSIFWNYIVPYILVIGGIAVTVYMISKGNKCNQIPPRMPILLDVEPEKTFANISENILNKVAKEEIPRGVKVKIESESLMTFIYKSASGKPNQRAQFIYDNKVDELRYLGDSRANVPRFFYEKLRESIDILKTSVT